MVTNSFKRFFPLFALFWVGFPLLWVLSFAHTLFYYGLILAATFRSLDASDVIRRRFFRFSLLMAILLVLIDYRTFLGYEPLMTLVLLAAASRLCVYRKAWELRHVGFLLICLTAGTSLVFQSPLVTLHTLLSFLWIGIIFLETSRSSQKFSAFISSGKQVAAYLFTAIPIIAMIYLFFPRYEEALFSIYRFKQQGKTGISGEVYPGIVRKIIEDDTLAFRAQVTPFTRVKDLYWRVLTLSYTDGIKWRESILDKAMRPLNTDIRITETDVVQEILLEPLLKNYLVGLDAPYHLNKLSDSRFRVQRFASRTFRLNQTLNTRLNYTVISDNQNFVGTKDQNEKIYRWVPQPLTGKVNQLTKKWAKQSHSKEEYLQLILQYFGDNLSYTLEPGTFNLEHDFLNELLFSVKKGFCEHFASALALLAREAGIPARLVVGYHGGEYNPYGQYWIVRQKNAHVWVEVYIERRGWIRIDPTNYVKPERIQNGRYDFDQPHMLHRLPFYPFFHAAVLRFDDLNTRWAQFLLWVNGSVENSMNEFQRTFKAYQMAGILLFVIMLVAYLLSVAWQGSFFKYTTANLEIQIVCLYKRVLKKIERRQLFKGRSEGPHDFLRRIESDDSVLASELKPFFHKYIKLRYDTPVIHSDQVKELRRIARNLRL